MTDPMNDLRQASAEVSGVELTKLSPAAQAVFDAYKEASDGVYIGFEWVQDEAGQIAAALRAVADQVVPYESTAPWNELKCDYDGDHWEMRQWVRAKIFAIANELEPQ